MTQSQEEVSWEKSENLHDNLVSLFGNLQKCPNFGYICRKMGSKNIVKTDLQNPTESPLEGV